MRHLVTTHAFIRRAGIEIAEVTFEQAKIARQAYRDFSKGRHEAGLNFGDCFAYALAIATGNPLLFKDDDFIHTDVIAYATESPDADDTEVTPS